ncbi:EAL domain-containing protein [Paenarthrobacter sp. NPDC089989]|uniref:EAL domain-containing protein n=1 Tax=unclassified Paenarthrobacter TaxID=2634190 RepID=UPI0038241DB2
MHSTLSTAFQPIRALDTGLVLGVEALTRFAGRPGQSPGMSFETASLAGCVVELEFRAMEAALIAAAVLPPHVYVSVNLSPQSCLDPRLDEVIGNARVRPRRVVLELTEHSRITDYDALRASLARVRAAGLRIAVDDTGAGFASMRHVLELKPDFIKLDRGIIGGIDTDYAKRAFGVAMVGFSSSTGAILVAEGIEREGELATLREIGVPAGQGFLLGSPTVLNSATDAHELITGNLDWSVPQTQKMPPLH